MKAMMEHQNAMLNIFMQKMGSSFPEMTANEPTMTDDGGNNSSGNEKHSQEDGKTPSKFKKKQAITVTPPENGGESKINAQTKMNIDSDEEFEITIKEANLSSNSDRDDDMDDANYESNSDKEDDQQLNQ